MKYPIYLYTLLLFVFYGCYAEEKFSSQPATLNIQLLASNMSSGTAIPNEFQLNDVVGFRFENGVLKEQFSQLVPDENGMLNLQPTQMSGILYILANASSAIQNAGLKAEETHIEEFLNMTADTGAMTENGLTMSGHMQLDKNMGSASVTLTRSVARIDISSPFEQVKVHNVKIDGIATEGYINSQEQPHLPENAVVTTYEKNYEEAPFENGEETLCYVCEQGTETHSVEVLITTSEGAWHRLHTSLPAIRRNTIYTLKIYGNGAELSLEAVASEWENGPSTETDLTLKGVIDRTMSQWSEGVRINEAGDSVYVPYLESNLKLTLKAEKGACFNVNGHVEGVNLTTQNLTRSLQAIAQINIASAKKMPGSIQEYIYLDTYVQNVHTGRIVLVFQPNPVRLEGNLKFDNNGMCDFEGYIDGELGIINLPSDRYIRLDIPETEAPWIKLEKTADENTYRILAGWKPNDPDADGRIQEARLIITTTNGDNSEETYTIKRQNWGLPVVNIHGTWWCKYNLRGNVKTFSDQILIKDEPAAAKENLFAYLQNCSQDELVELLGDQYQAGNPDGLKLTHQDNLFYYEGFQNSTKNFGTMPPTEMAPSGYQIPGYDDFRFFTWGNDCNLGYDSSGVFNNKLGQRLNYAVVERTLNVDGIEYGPIELYDFNYDGTRWNIMGLGHQWNAQSISKNIILLATYGNENNTWLIEGYPQDDGRGNWFKYSNHNAMKTRTIRCIKTPVEYIYE